MEHDPASADASSKPTTDQPFVEALSDPGEPGSYLVKTQSDPGEPGSYRTIGNAVALGIGALLGATLVSVWCKYCQSAKKDR